LKNSHLSRGLRGRRSDGFTLFEVVVALAIAAIGLGFLMSATSTGIGNAALAYRYVEATRRAQSHLAEVGVSVPFVAGATSGDDGDGFTWTLRISPAVTHANGASPTGGARTGLYTVDVSVSWRSGVSIRTVSLRSQRIGGA
jgi:prepilin-type N-terminal cleavage/methylation domain-containing protein